MKPEDYLIIENSEEDERLKRDLEEWEWSQEYKQLELIR